MSDNYDYDIFECESKSEESFGPETPRVNNILNKYNVVR